MRRKPLYCIAPSPAYVSRGCLALPSNYGSSSSSSQPRTSRCGIPSLYFRTGVTEVLARFVGYTTEASTAAFTQSYSEFQCVASQQEPSSRARGILIDGFDSTTKSMRALFPGARLGHCLRHALIKLPKKLAAITSPVRQALRTKFHRLVHRSRQRKGLRVFALGQRLRHFADHVAATAGPHYGAP